MKYRPDIDGLRAIAILAVLLFHFFPKTVRGGFVGVDVFFVLSGFLISTIIMSDLRSGNFTFRHFMIKRVLRIFPSLILVLWATLGLGWALLLSEEYLRFGESTLFSAGFLANILLWKQTGYFDAASELKPLLHLWSLGIEEQFYFLWPAILYICWKKSIRLIYPIVAILIASFVTNLFTVTSYPTATFYLPLTRFWEMLIGALLAWLVLEKKSFGVSSLAGFAMVIGSVLFFNDETTFPGIAALLPTIGTMLIIAAGEGSAFNRKVLSHPLLVKIGLISYPLYLWHWPLLSLTRIIEGQFPSRPIRLVTLALSFLLAQTTYLYLEKPLKTFPKVRLSLVLTFLLFATGLAGYSIQLNEGFPQRHELTEKNNSNLGPGPWGKAGWVTQESCLQKYGRDLQFCLIHDPLKEPTAILIGDSTANHFFPGLASKLSKSNENLLNLGIGGCPPLLGLTAVINEGEQDCDKFTKILLKAAENPGIKTILISMLGIGYDLGTRTLVPDEKQFIKLHSRLDPKLTDRRKILETSLRQTLKTLLPSGKEVIFIGSIPMLNFSPAECIDSRPWKISPLYLKDPCAQPREVFDESSAGYRAMVRGILKDFRTIKYWDPASLLCDDKLCRSMTNKLLLYRDTVHLSESGSFWLSERWPFH